MIIEAGFFRDGAAFAGRIDAIEDIDRLIGIAGIGERAEIEIAFIVGVPGDL
jgi:hypothetical protein